MYAAIPLGLSQSVPIVAYDMSIQLKSEEIAPSLFPSLPFHSQSPSAGAIDHPVQTARTITRERKEYSKGSKEWGPLITLLTLDV